MSKVSEHKSNLTRDQLSRLLTGCSVSGFSGGIGSFFYLHFLAPDDRSYKIWIYLCDWAFLKDGYEFASSDIEKIGSSIDLSDLIGERLEKIKFWDDDSECHFDISNGLRLEMWMNFEAYPGDQEMFLVFSDDQFVAVHPGGEDRSFRSSEMKRNV